MKPSNATLSRSSPKGGKRGCLCKDGRTYSVKCCDGTLQAQGIGAISEGGPPLPVLIPWAWGLSNTLLSSAQIAQLIEIGNCNLINDYAVGELKIVWGATGKYLWFATQSVYPTKTKWFNTPLNQGNIGLSTDLFGPNESAFVNASFYNTDFKIYRSNYATTTSGLMTIE